MKKLWDSSEIREAAALFNDLLKYASTYPVPAAPADRITGVSEKASPKAYRADLLEEALISMCTRGEFSGAILADNNGLPLAIYNSPVAENVLAAFTSVLGNSLAESGRLLNQPNANHISMDINYIDKIVLRKFLLDDFPYFLMIISPQNVDERAELELSINHISAVLKP